MVSIAAQPGLDYQLIDDQGYTAASWVAFNQPQGYGVKNDVSVVLVSSQTGVRVQSLPVHFDYDQPYISRVYPEEPFDCPTIIKTIYIGAFDGTHTDITVVLNKPKPLLNGSKVQITGWTGTYNDNGVAKETTFLSDTFTASAVELVSADSDLSNLFHVKYKRQVPTGTQVVNMGTVQVRRNGIRLKIEGRNFCQLSSHPAASPACGRVVIAPETSSTSTPGSDAFNANSIREVCTHAHDSIGLLLFVTSGHIRIDTWDIDDSKIQPDPSMPVPTSGSQYLTSNSAYFDQQTPQTNAVFRQRLTPSRYRAQSIATTSTGVVTINMGQMNSKCLVTGTTVTFENAYRHDLNGPHIITSLPADPSNLLFTVASTVAVSSNLQGSGSLLVACPTFQTHGVDVLTFSGTYWPQNADFFEILIGDTPPALDVRKEVRRRRLAVNVTQEAAHQVIMEDYFLQLSTGRAGTKCVLTPECRAEANFVEGNQCLKVDVNAITGERTFTVSCTVPAGAGIDHPVVINRLGVRCALEDSNGNPITTRCADNSPPNLATLSSLTSLQTNPLLTYSAPVVFGMYKAEANAQNGYTCDTSTKLILVSDSADVAIVPPTSTQHPKPPFRIRSPTKGDVICIQGRNFGSDKDQTTLHVGRWTNDFPSYQNVVGQKIHSTTSNNYDQMFVHIPPGDGEGAQNKFTLNVASIAWPNVNPDASEAWWTLNVQYEEPIITSVSPTIGPAEGFDIVMTGANFGPGRNPLLPIIRLKSKSTLHTTYYNCTVGSAAHRGHTSITCTLDKGVGKDLDLSIQVNGQEHTLQQAISYEPPNVESASPDRVHTKGGQNVTVVGSNFGVEPASLRLVSRKTTGASSKETPNHADVADINIPTNNIVSWQDNRIVFVAPEGYGKSFGIVVTAGLQESNSDVLMGYHAPSISNITLAGNRLACSAMIRNDNCGAPTLGGFLVEIIGKDFSSYSELSKISKKLFEIDLGTPYSSEPITMGWCGGGQRTACVVPEQHKHESIVLYMPAGIGSLLPLRIRVANQLDQSAVGKNMFSYDPPWINAITPREGNAGSIGTPNGNRIKIEGINFGEPDSVTVADASFSSLLQVFIGGKECLNAAKVQESGQPTHIECSTQRDRVGYKDIVLITAQQNISYSAQEWECNSTDSLCGGAYFGGKQLFMMQCEDNTYGLFGEWCVDCPHVTDVVSEAQAIDAGADSQQIGEITGGCGTGTIGADVCVKPVLRNGELDYIAHCPTGSSRVEVLPGKESEAYDVNRIYEHGMCNTPDAYHLSERVRLACAPFSSEGFFKYYTNSSDTDSKQIATSRCHSLRQPPGGNRQACSFVVACEPKTACYSNNVCALDDEDEELHWNKNTEYVQGNFIMMPNNPSNMYVCHDAKGCRKGLDPTEERSLKLKEESAALTQDAPPPPTTTLTTAVNNNSSGAGTTANANVNVNTAWLEVTKSGTWKVKQKYSVGDLVYHRLNSSLGDTSCDNPNDLSCSREISEYYAYLCLPSDTKQWNSGCSNTGTTTPGNNAKLWRELRPRYSNYKRRIAKDPLYVGRCSQCAKGFFRLDGVCTVCPNNPIFLMVAIVLGFIGVGVAFYILHTKNINTAILTIGVDYFQIVALFSRARIRWPKLLKDIFRLFSFFNFNIDLAAPECLAVFGYDTKWLIFMSVPLVLIGFALFGVSGKFCQKCVYRYSKLFLVVQVWKFFFVFFGIWNVKRGTWTVDCGLWTVDCGLFLFLTWYYFLFSF